MLDQCIISAGHSSNAGAESGLYLHLNVEQYEYMRGPHGTAGVKILLHDQNEIPRVAALGDAISTGSSAFVGVRSIHVSVNNVKRSECL